MLIPMSRESFEWNSIKDAENRGKHGVSFAKAQRAFSAPKRIIARDLTRSTAREERYDCFGRVGGGIMTVRFTYRSNRVRIFGAGCWRKGRQIYERENQVQ